MKHLVMLGAGHAHVHLLSTLAAQTMAGVQITLVAPYPHHLYAGMLPGFVAGRYTLEECVIPLAPFLKDRAITRLQRRASGLDAAARTVTLDDGSSLHYDVLSINSGPVQDRPGIEAIMPGAREHALFVRPPEVFAALWPQVVALGQEKPLRVALIGGGAAGCELACAVAHRLPGSSVTLLGGDAPVGASDPPAVQAMMRHALTTRRVTVIQERCVGMAAGEVTLASGARLACDVPIVTTGAQAPAWLQSSGVALDAQGFVTVDAFQRSTSHPEVFVAADPVHAGPPLAQNLRAVLAGIAPKTCTPQGKTLNLLSCGDHRAMASWGNWSAQGRWVGWLKDRIDRGFVRKYRRG